MECLKVASIVVTMTQRLPTARMGEGTSLGTTVAQSTNIEHSKNEI